MTARRISLWSFLVSLVVYPFSFHSTFTALAGLAVLHGGGAAAEDIREIWWMGRSLAVVVGCLLLLSVITAFLAPPVRGRRIWWVTPATVCLIVLTYFDYMTLGFRI